MFSFSPHPPPPLLGIEPRAFPVLGWYSVMELYSQPCFLPFPSATTIPLEFFLFFSFILRQGLMTSDSLCSKGDLELMIFLPIPVECWDYRHVLIYPSYAELGIKPRVLFELDATELHLKPKILVLCDRVSLCDPGWTQTCNLPSSVSAS